ncbi:hypothetical protein N7U66_13280 [Lacinutrix neustonica]|uniref:Uncharacterized protein n=1 Tax=Lacinutrix neustonica TaxID=2980107 RepID=A0A9E8SCC1_9FLAO|nr:hypothetical protein [Lacinutrix neustonica]WAC01128.1 hypothetical protein N7U66_13280 [Lacinutrix neustonica]
MTTPVVEQPDPCQKIAQLKNDDVFKQKMNILKGAAEQWSFEKMFTVYDDPTPNTEISQSDNYDYDEFQGTASNPFVSWTGNSTIKGVIHSHYDGLLSVPSPTDLQDMYNQLLTPTVTSDFFYGVVTHSGKAYILQVNDRSNFINFGNKNLINNKINKFIKNKIIKKYNIKENNTNATNELGFVKMLEELNVGLNIYKATDLTFSDYQKLEIQNNQVTATPCN